MDRLLTKDERNAISSVISYLYDDELEDYNSYDIPPEDHIFVDIRTLVNSPHDFYQTDFLENSPNEEREYQKSLNTESESA